MNHYLGKQLVGTWRLIACTDEDQLGEPIHFFGNAPTGMLMYDEHGYMNVQMINLPRNKFASDAIGAGAPEETYAAFHSYNAYYGRYYEEKAGEIVHVVEGSLFPNFTGIKFIRYATLHDDELVLTTPPLPVHDKQVTFRLVWKRLQ